MQVLATEKLHIEQIYSASYDDIMPNGIIYHYVCLANERLAIRQVDYFPEYRYRCRGKSVHLYRMFILN